MVNRFPDDAILYGNDSDRARAVKVLVRSLKVDRNKVHVVAPKERVSLPDDLR